ncbi:MAG: hypothetical protein ACYC8T_22375 [Myxococcaceae bacterium]
MSRGAPVVLLSCVWLCGCQCAGVPQSACFEGEPCEVTADGGAGADAGAEDAGQALDGGRFGPRVGSVFADAGICDDWQCVTEKAPPHPLPAHPAFTVERVSVPAVASGCTQRWLGGVLLPDGRVMAVPRCAARFLVIDPQRRTAELVGQDVPLLNGQRFGGGVLGCDGRLYALPYDLNYLMRVTAVADGGFDFEQLLLERPPGPPGSPHFRGAVVGASCATGFVIYATGEHGTAAIEPHELGLELAPAWAPPPGNGPFGMVRTPRDDTLGAVWDTSLKSDLYRLVPFYLPLPTLFFGTGEPIFGAAVGTNGNLVLQGAEGGLHRYLPDGGLSYEQAPLPPVGPLRWPATRGDGYVYTLGPVLRAVPEAPGWPTFEELRGELSDAGVVGPEPFGGLVVTPSGALVAIPAEFPDVLLLVPDGGAPAMPREVLLSPYFNKL